MNVLSDRAAFLLSGVTASAYTGEVMDARATRNYGFLTHISPAASSLFTLQASHDMTAWMTVAQYTALTTRGSAQMSGYFPYVRAQINAVWSGGGNTGQPQVFYAPGLM